MSGTVLGKSCLVLGAEFGMWNAKAAPGAVSGRGIETAPGMGTLPRGIQFPGGIQRGSTAQLPASCPSSWNCSHNGSGAEPELPREAWPGAAPGAPQPNPATLGHTTIPTDTSCLGKPSWNSSGSG